MNETNKLKYSPNTEFYKELRTKVNAYFEDNSRSKRMNKSMILKIIVLSGFFIASFLNSLLFKMEDILYIFFQLIVGASLILMALNIGHDAAHNSLSKNKKVNILLSVTLNLAGASSYLWKFVHNIHHMYPNIHGYDGDISYQNILRMSPYQPKKWFHRYQHIYIFVVSCFTTFTYLFHRDYKTFFSEKIENVYVGKHSKIRLFRLILSKLLHVSLFLVLPYFVTDYSITVLIIGFCFMHFSAGIILYFIFNLAHQVNDVAIMEPSTERMETSWAEQQLLTTCNYGNSVISNFLFGGLNNQIEHHLFPNICHIHYKNISKLVRETAHKYKLPYYQNKSFSQTFILHLDFMKELGK